MGQKRRALILAVRVKPVDDQNIRLGTDDGLQIGKAAMRADKALAGQSDAKCSHEIARQGRGPGGIATALHDKRRKPFVSALPCKGFVDIGDQRLAARRMADMTGDQPNRITGLVQRARKGHFGDPIAEAPQHVFCRTVGETASQNQIRLHGDNSLGGRGKMRIIRRRRSSVRQPNIPGETAEPDNLIGISQRQHQLIGAHVQGNDALGRFGHPMPRPQQDQRRGTGAKTADKCPPKPFFRLQFQRHLLNHLGRPGTHSVTGGSDEPDRNSKGLLMYRVFAPGFAAGLFALCVSAPHALAQSGVSVLPEITVFSPFRGIATPIARAGSAVSVITREDIEQAGQVSVAEILRTVPGVSFTSSGGVGSSTDVRIRGAEEQHTMVLIDGVPVTDTTSTRNSFDFTMLPIGSIERIEVLRGPQSALYGSDALGGVIAITTRRPTRGMTATASVEGGSFGTHREALSFAYGNDRFGITWFGEHFSTDGFSRRVGNDEADGTTQWTGGVRGQANVSDTVTLDAAFQITDLETEYDRRSNDPNGESDRVAISGHARASHEGFDGRWRQTLTAFGSSTDRQFTEGTDIGDYSGTRFGLEYTGEVHWETFGTTLYGVTGEQQAAEYIDNGTIQFDEEEFYWGTFAMQQFSIGPSLHLSAAVRFDDFADAGTFVTGRGTAAYEVHATETRFHASLGTGAKAPSLRQRTATPTLRPEESWGVDAGVTQTLFDGRLTVDVTGFYQEIEDLHVYTGTCCSFATESWDNVDQARLMGVEVTADARLIPGQLDVSAHYTYLDAEDATTGDRLQRRPEHEAQVALTYTGIDRLRLSGIVNWVGGERFSRSRERDPLDPYVRVDLNGSYQVRDSLEFYGRVENLFDVHYEEIKGYNTPGLSAFVGLRGTLR